MIVKNSKLFIAISLLFMLVSFALLFIFPIKLSPELAGSARITLNATENIDINNLLNSLTENNFKVLDSYQKDSQIQVGFEPIFGEDYIKLQNFITDYGSLNIERFESFSPEISTELIKKSIITILLSSLIIILFIAWSFSHKDSTVSSFRYGVISIIALLHDALIPLGVLAVAGFFLDVKLDILIITAILAVIGYSVNDTIVVFDRIRENISKGVDLEKAVNNGVFTSLRRSVFTSITTILPLVFIFINIPIVRWFAVVIFIGVLVGTYSSLFFASSMFYVWNKKIPLKIKTEQEKSDLEIAEEKLAEKIKGIDVL